MESRFVFNIEDLLTKWGLPENYVTLLNILSGIILIVIIAVITDFVLKRIIIALIERIVKKSKTAWDDILLNRKVLKRLSHLAPALVIFYSLRFVLYDYESIVTIVQEAIKIYIIILSLMIVNPLINGLHSIYRTLPVSKDRSIGGYIQVVKIIIYLIAILLIISVLFNKELTRLLTGLGAIAAILILVFKDTILGFVASIQLSANNMIKVGDWITMPKYNADGTVIEISLHTVKVQNWDKTIITIPTYALVSDSFTNYKGMEESGGRRIKRSINIDMKSVKFCTREMVEKFRKIQFLKEYVEEKQSEIELYNKENKIDESVIVNGRRMTNIGTFRKYLENYLHHHPKIHNNMTFLVRQLQPTDKGIPIEVYVFSNDQRWANYESIQSDIFDHILAVIPEFELSVFQSPSGDDFQKALSS
ncbi:MAG: mechanosensitive ion channel [Bacteroidales bacterium]|nr:MAG: mechanosensitive ion channel [Bacteroidales bacterium]